MIDDEKRKWYSPRRWLARFAQVQEFELIEVRQLGANVLGRMIELQEGADKRHEAWVAAEFQYPLRSLLIKAALNSSLFLAISMVVVAGGFATSGITVAANASQGSLAAWIVFSLGLLVALAGGLAQIFRFGVRSNARRSLAVLLKEEGWNFVYAEGEYADSSDALQKFRARVHELQRRVAEVALIDADASPATPSPNGAQAQEPAPNV